MDARTSQTAERLYEQVLVLRCQAGDSGAFAELVGRYQQRLGYYVRGLAGSTDLVEDTLQEVWLSVYRKISTLRDTRSFKVWLYRVARNAFLAGRRATREWTELADDIEDPGEDEGDPLVSAEDAARLHAALGRLRPEQREVITLRFLEEMSYEDMASVTGCPIGTLRSRLHHARQSLARELGG